jgi:ATP-dependent Clp protease adapter protein ClpS
MEDCHGLPHSQGKQSLSAAAKHGGSNRSHQARGRALERWRGLGIVSPDASSLFKSAAPPPTVAPRPRVAPHKPREKPQTAPPALEPPWHVILLDDEVHSHEYVIEMLNAIFGHSRELAMRMADEVDASGVSSWRRFTRSWRSCGSSRSRNTVPTNACRSARSRCARRLSARSDRRAQRSLAWFGDAAQDQDGNERQDRREACDEVKRAAERVNHAAQAGGEQQRPHIAEAQHGLVAWSGARAGKARR